MGKRKQKADENETPLLADANPCPSTKDDPVPKEILSCMQSLRHPRRYGHVYSRRKPTNKSTVSTPPSSTPPSIVTKHDEKLSGLNFDCQSSLGSELNTEKSEKALCGPEWNRTSSLPAKAGYTNPAKKVCGLCKKLLKRKPFVLENSVALEDLSVVAVLVCGHIYHADCLEPRTSVEDQSDPICPLCVESLSSGSL